jgi:hypothetical protein
VGAAGTADTAGLARRMASRDRHASGDECHSIPCCAPVARGATFRVKAFRRARRPTTSFANSSEGVWESIWAELYMALREPMGREASPSAAVLDSQSVKSAEKGVVETTR